MITRDSLTCAKHPGAERVDVLLARHSRSQPRGKRSLSVHYLPALRDGAQRPWQVVFLSLSREVKPSLKVLGHLFCVWPALLECVVKTKEEVFEINARKTVKGAGAKQVGRAGVKRRLVGSGKPLAAGFLARDRSIRRSPSKDVWEKL
ncbi:hypothetical protein [Corynebacterium aquilae]|uniref:hypothetical protein n=1 Tax=Corynebacterium aquilae TaxID=203263 RepID=UPI0012EEE066|nr:hypothetical protein [Corynebacterium aquilae]